VKDIYDYVYSWRQTSGKRGRALALRAGEFATLPPGRAAVAFPQARIFGFTRPMGKHDERTDSRRHYERDDATRSLKEWSRRLAILRCKVSSSLSPPIRGWLAAYPECREENIPVRTDIWNDFGPGYDEAPYLLVLPADDASSRIGVGVGSLESQSRRCGRPKREHALARAAY
jgi:hypothetical protein